MPKIVSEGRNVQGEKGPLVCELTGEEFEAALNVARFLRDERAAGRLIDLRRIRSFRVYRHPRNTSLRVIEVVNAPEDF